MTEEKEKVNPNVEKILTEITKLNERIGNMEKTLSPKPSEEKPHEHWKADEIIKTSDACPECKAEKEKLRDAFGKPYLEAHWREKLPHVCKNCGEGVLIEEESCPKCKGTGAKKRA